MMIREIDRQKKQIMVAIAVLIFSFVLLPFLGHRLLIITVIKTQLTKEQLPGLFITPHEHVIGTQDFAAAQSGEIRFESLTAKTSFGTPERTEEKADKNVSPETVYLYGQDRQVEISTHKNYVREMLMSVVRGDEGKARFLFGDTVMDSSYGAHKLALEYSPDQIGIFSSAKDLNLALIISFWKALAVSNDAQSISHFEIGDIRGFQIGEPSKSKSICIFVFNANDDQAYEIDLKGEMIKQQDVDFLISSIKIGDANRYNSVIK